ncbi:hypothetical protein CSV71_12805 [Sporosarcina sp. P21c]|uniref:hypothetical protein n=1 Tax=unclassified Sporosarcina TaxID=2647733 RepID=UPI000C168B53|nr:MULTISPECIES: hypothetical protein [unclassified Sporosarcina]PIC66145.1 hypothetical protein CSV78_13865 [Sporosarcina sp. P16a]PIC88786.1 hypothetical protein CSV71_12805 [Sporosarcina sp. P21c]PIC91809.1 hypothetical protein CSV70_13535 [Sporosarcina sp. P25]
MSNDDFTLSNIFGKFIEDEIMDIETFKLIYDFVALDNFRQGEYEGNMFVIRKINTNYIQLEDEVATANTPKPKVFVYTRKEFLSLLQSHKPGF